MYMTIKMIGIVIIISLIRTTVTLAKKKIKINKLPVSLKKGKTK